MGVRGGREGRGKSALALDIESSTPFDDIVRRREIFAVKVNDRRTRGDVKEKENTFSG